RKADPHQESTMSRTFRCFLTCVFCLAGLIAGALAAENSGTVRFKLGSATIEGRPMFWTKSSAAVLANDGRLWQFEPEGAKDLERFKQPLHSQSLVQMRGDLQREF